MQAKKHNGSSGEAELELDHELPPAEEDDALFPQTVAGARPRSRKSRNRNWSGSAAERAAYLDRAARIQAEFDNFRKRNARGAAGIPGLRPRRRA